MPSVSDQAFTDFFRMNVQAFGKDPTLYENQCPGYMDLDENSETLDFDIKGYRIPLIATRPGGSTSATPGNSSFNVSVPMTTVSMFVFPTWYYLPMVFQEAAIHMAKKNKQRLIEFGGLLKQWWDTGLKRQEYYTYGDGSALLAVYTGSTLNVGAGQTYTGTTAAATSYGQTKGSYRLDQNSSFDSVNPSTGLPRGNFTVTTGGFTSCTVTVNWGTIVSGDIATDPGAYLKAPRGYAHLISNVSRTLQGLPTSQFQFLNSPLIDLANTLLTPAAMQLLKSKLQFAYNEEGKKNGLRCTIPYGQHGVLAKQGWNLHLQGENKTTGFPMQYQDGDTKIVQVADQDDDRVYLRYAASIKKFVETDMRVMTMGTPDEWRMLMGNNGTGSADFQRSLEMHWNAGVVTRVPGAVIIRSLLGNNIATQVNSLS